MSWDSIREAPIKAFNYFLSSLSVALESSNGNARYEYCILIDAYDPIACGPLFEETLFGCPIFSDA